MIKYIIISFLIIYCSIKANEPEGNKYVKAEIMTPANYYKPGLPIPLAIKMHIADGWHIYWVNSGDSGMPTEIRLDVPSDFDVSPFLLPYPQRFSYHEMADYGFKGIVYAVTNIHTQPSHSSDLKITATLDFLVCKDKCIPGKIVLEHSLPINLSPTKEYLDTKRNLELARQIEFIPTTNHSFQFKAVKKENSIELEIIAPDWFERDIEDIWFFPYKPGYFDNGAEQKVQRIGNRLVLDLKLDNFRDGEQDTVYGVLVSQSGLAYHDMLDIWLNSIIINVPIE